jgi:hypothetical protein
MLIIAASIDVSKIDKSKIVAGKKGRYYNIDIIVGDEPNQFGQQVSIIEKQTPEQRKAKDKKKYLGNGKIVFKKDAETGSNPQNEPIQDSNDDLPF